jgi:hypothetical protein
MSEPTRWRFPPSDLHPCRHLIATGHAHCDCALTLRACRYPAAAVDRCEKAAPRDDSARDADDKAT